MRVTKSILIKRAFFGVFWVLATIGFICDEFIPEVESVRTYIMLACDAMLALLGLLCLRHRTDILFIFALALISFGSSVVFNGLSPFFAANGMRVFIGLMFCYPIFRYFMDDAQRREHFIKTLDKNLEIFLWLQVPCIAFQFIAYGADDHVGGSLGNWYSGTISMLIYIISFYLMHKRIDQRDFAGSIIKNFKYVLLLTPTFFNETKISFVLLVIYFILLMPLDKRIYKRAIISLPILVVLFALGYSTYKITYKGDVSSTTDEIDIFSEDYLVEYVLSDVGFGVGHFKGGTKMDHSEFYDHYEWYLIGTMPYLIHIYLQLGVVGLLLFLGYLVSLFFRHPDGCSIRDMNLQIFMALLIGMNLFYAESLRDPFFAIIIYGFVACSWLPDESSEEKLGVRS